MPLAALACHFFQKGVEYQVLASPHVPANKSVEVSMLEYAKSDIHRRVGRPKGPGRAVKGAVASEVVLSGFVFYIKSNLGNRWIPDQGTEAHHLPWHRSTFPGQSLHIFAVTSRQQLPKSSSNSHVNVVAIILSATHNHSPTWGFIPVSAYQPSTGCKNSALYFFWCLRC